jgi:hypothetical protein
MIWIVEDRMYVAREGNGMYIGIVFGRWVVRETHSRSR